MIAADDAVFGLPEIKLGLLPLMVLAPILRVTAPRRVLELIVTGRELPAREAVEIGLANRAVPRAELAAAVGDVARRLAALSPATLALGKEAFYRALELPYSQALAQLRDYAVLRALGLRARRALGLALAQVGAMVAAAFAAALLLVWVLAQLLPALSPLLTLEIEARDVAQALAVAGAVALGAAAFPAIRVSRVDPASVFRR